MTELCTCGVELQEYEEHDAGNPSPIRTYLFAASTADYDLFYAGKIPAHDIAWWNLDSEGFTDRHTVFGRCAGEMAGEHWSNETMFTITPKEANDGPRD